jgi:hypothetical protein
VNYPVLHQFRLSACPTIAAGNPKDSNESMTANNSRNPSNGRNESNNRTTNTVETPAKAGMLAEGTVPLASGMTAAAVEKLATFNRDASNRSRTSQPEHWQ